MVINQNKFNNNHPEEVRKIELEDEKFEGQLVVENYSELEDLYLQNVKSIEEITLKNLVGLQKCTIWDCGMKKLIIDNCPQIKTLNVRTNSLTSLEFVKDLENLKELELDGNTKLVEILRPYLGSWEIYKNNIQTLVKLAKENPQKLLDLKEKGDGLEKKYADLKTFLKEIWVSLSKEMKTELINKLDDEIKNKSREQRMLVNNVTSGELNTTELIFKVKKSLEGMKELKKELEMKNQELENKTKNLHEIIIKKDELEKLKNSFIEKRVGLLGKREKVQNSLESFLTSVRAQMLYSDPSFTSIIKKEERYLLKGKTELTELLDELRKKQEGISSLEGNQPIQGIQVAVKEITTESEEKKAVDLQVRKDKFQFGIPTPWGTVGAHWEKDRTHLNISKQDLQQNKEVVTELGWKLVEKLLEIQKVEEKNQNVAQIEQLK